MFKCYDKKVLSSKTSPEARALYSEASRHSGREYNRAVAGAIVDDLLQALDDQQSLDFLPHIPVVLPLIQSGMFYTAAEYLKTVSVSNGLEPIREELINCLNNADDTQEVADAT